MLKHIVTCLCPDCTETKYRLNREGKILIPVAKEMDDTGSWYVHYRQSGQETLYRVHYNIWRKFPYA